MKAATKIILFFLTISISTSTVQAQARRAPITNKTRIARFVIRDSLSTSRVVDHRATNSRTSTQRRTSLGNRTKPRAISTFEKNRRVVDHRQKSNIVTPSNRTAKIKKLPPDGTSNTRSLTQRVVVKRKQ